MSNRYTSQYGAVIPNIDEDRASRKSSRTSYSQQSGWDSSSLATSRTYYASSSPSFSSSASSSRTFYESQRPSYVSQTSIVTARQQRPNPSPAYSVSSYQASIVDSGEALRKDNFSRTTADAYPIAPAPAQPNPSQYQYQQQPNANPPTQGPSPKGLKRLFSGLNLNRRGSKTSVGGSDAYARSPPPTSGGGLAASTDKRSRQASTQRPISKKAQPQTRSSNVGSCYQFGRMIGEPAHLPQPHEEFGQWGDSNTGQDDDEWTFLDSNKRNGQGSYNY